MAIQAFVIAHVVEHWDLCNSLVFEVIKHSNDTLEISHCKYNQLIMQFGYVSHTSNRCMKF